VVTALMAIGATSDPEAVATLDPEVAACDSGESCEPCGNAAVRGVTAPAVKTSFCGKLTRSQS
jgi:hypothetical protein